MEFRFSDMDLLSNTLHDNLVFLNFDFDEAVKDHRVCFGRKIFHQPNVKAYQVLILFLLTKRYGDEFTSSISQFWPISQSKDRGFFDNVVLKRLKTLKEENISYPWPVINMGLLMRASGRNFYLLFLCVSNCIIERMLSKKSLQFNIGHETDEFRHVADGVTRSRIKWNEFLVIQAYLEALKAVTDAEHLVKRVLKAKLDLKDLEENTKNSQVIHDFTRTGTEASIPDHMNQLKNSLEKAEHDLALLKDMVSEIMSANGSNGYEVPCDATLINRLYNEFSNSCKSDHVENPLLDGKLNVLKFFRFFNEFVLWKAKEVNVRWLSKIPTLNADLEVLSTSLDALSEKVQWIVSFREKSEKSTDACGSRAADTSTIVENKTMEYISKCIESTLQSCSETYQKMLIGEDNLEKVMSDSEQRKKNTCGSIEDLDGSTLVNAFKQMTLETSLLNASPLYRKKWFPAYDVEDNARIWNLDDNNKKSSPGKEFNIHDLIDCDDF